MDMQAPMEVGTLVEPSEPVPQGLQIEDAQALQEGPEEQNAPPENDGVPQTQKNAKATPSEIDLDDIFNM